jgi:hypothetical protein
MTYLSRAMEPASQIYPQELDTPEFRKCWAEYEEYRRHRRLARLQPDTLKRRFAEYASWGHDAAIDAINFSITQNYQGVFRPSNGSTKPKNGPSEFAGAF